MQMFHATVWYKQVINNHDADLAMDECHDFSSGASFPENPSDISLSDEQGSDFSTLHSTWLLQFLLLDLQFLALIRIKTAALKRFLHFLRLLCLVTKVQPGTTTHYILYAVYRLCSVH